MLPFPAVIPAWLIKLGVIVLLLGLIVLSAYMKGRHDVRAAWDLERAQIAAVAAKQELQNAQTEKAWLQQANQAEVKYGKALDVTRSRAAAELARLRESYARAGSVPGDTAAAPGCAVCAQCATSAELLGIGAELVRVAEAADRERAAAVSCAGSWPR